MKAVELLAGYEATGDEAIFGEAQRLYEQTLAGAPIDTNLYMYFGRPGARRVAHSG